MSGAITRVRAQAAQLAHPSGVQAVIRAVAVPVFYAAERLVDHPVAGSAPFDEMLVVAGVYALATLGAELRGRRLVPPPLLAGIDLLLITGLVATSGGPFSQLRYAFFILPVAAALLLRPRLTAIASAATVVMYGLVVLTFPDAEQVRDDARGFEVTQTLFLIWMGAAATMLSGVLTRRDEEIRALAASRGRLVAQALDAEDRARRRLAEGLHDEALQNLLAARQLLDAGDAGAAALAREGLEEGIGQIRGAVFDLHPYLLEQSGLRAALAAVAERAARRAGFATHVTVADEAEGAQDTLLFSIGRELIANAAKHSGARRLDIDVTRGEDGLEMVVRDDGRGVDPERMRRAPADGHIGLASCAERAEAVGGTLLISAGDDDRGTVVRVVVPA